MNGSKYPVVRFVLLLCALAALVWTAGCGGSGGGSGGGSTNISLAGAVNLPVTQLASKSAAVSGVTVKAYVYPDLTTVAQTSAATDANGRYSLTFSPDMAGKGIVLTTETAGLRGSLVVGHLPAAGRSDADIDTASTITAETVLAKAKSAQVAAINDSAVVTINTEAHKWSGLSSFLPKPDGTNLPAVLGAGLPALSPALTGFVSTNNVVAAALAAVGDTGNAGVQSARDLMQMLRDLGHTVVVSAQTNGDSLTAAVNEQNAAITQGTRISAGIGTRVKTVYDIIEGNGGSWDRLIDKAPGNYNYIVDPANPYGRKLVLTGAAADGKSWVITSQLTNATANDVVTITPAVALSNFHVTKNAGKYTATVTGPDPKLNWGMTLAFTTNSSNALIEADINVTMNDPALNTPITLTGSMKGNGVTVDANNVASYQSVTLAGTLTSQFVNGNLGGLTVSWSSTPDKLGNLQSVTLTNASLTTQFTKQISFTVPSASITFSSPAGAKAPSPQEITYNSTLTASGHTFTITGGDLTFAQVGAADVNKVQISPNSLKGTINYTSPSTILTGSLTGTWTNPSPLMVDFKFVNNPFPTGSIRLNGSLTPAIGLPSALDITLSSDTTSATPNVTLTIANLAYGSKTLSGAVVQPLTVAGGKVSSNGAATLNINTSDSLTVKMTDTSNVLTGTISSGSTKLADIGSASALGLPDLGGATIVKYSDGTFETAASLLP